MKTDQIRSMTDSEILSNLNEFIETLNDLKFNHLISPIENPARIKMLKKDIARMKTILSERENNQN